MSRLVLVAELPGAAGASATAAALAVACACGDGQPVALIEVGGRRRGPTMLASSSARSLEERMRAAGRDCCARGRFVSVPVDASGGWEDELVATVTVLGETGSAVVCLPPPLVRWALARAELGVDAVVLRAELPRQRALAALAVRELRAAGVPVKIARRAPGRVATRRALAGIEPGGDASPRAERLAAALLLVRGRRRRAGRREPALAAESGQALPLVIAGVAALIGATLVLAAFGGAVTGKSRTQRAADLAALSAARSMRDDFDRLFVPARRPDGSPNPAHLAKAAYLARARDAGEDAARRNHVDPGRLAIEFPDRASFAPLRVRARVEAELETPGDLPRVPVTARADAEAVPPATAAFGSGPTYASGGGYSGPLEYRQGEGMRPDVAAAFDRIAAAARADGVSLLINDGFRSDAEQAVLWAQNPDPRWVAPPGTSLHRCATELDLGPPAAYAWLAANATRFGFVQRYPWEAWHYGFDAGPAPCSAAGDDLVPDGSPASAAGSPDGDEGEISLPSFVPARFRAVIARAAQRWDVSGTLLAAQLMAESNFNPFALSPTGAAGIAQFMPATAAAYGLGDPFDAEAAIYAQAHLMSDLLSQFVSPALALAAYNAGPAPVAACGCVPGYPETQAYVARILALVDGAGSSVAGGLPPLEVRLVD